MNKYNRVKQDLLNGKESSMKVFGKSMEPIIYSGTKLTFKTFDSYDIGDIVFCKVKGRIIDAHKITKIRMNGDSKEYMIANNHGWENGWTRTIFGKVIKIGERIL